MSYFLKLIVFSLVITACVVVWNMFIPKEYISLHAYFIIPFFFVYSYLTHLSLTKALKDENKNAFTMRFMGATGIKLFFSLIFIVVYSFVNKAGLIPFAVLFLFLYFAFTIFETMILFKQLKKDKQTNQ
ncbi:MAG: hypothetical protein Q8M29_04270 [Bacteroidota bacterium]|nr:hypothetical protein [Bacteroidota bacterium]